MLKKTHQIKFMANASGTTLGRGLKSHLVHIHEHELRKRVQTTVSLQTCCYHFY